MKRKLKSLFRLIFLLPIMPILGVAGEGDEEDEKDEEDEGDEGEDESKDKNKTFTQDEVDALITKRLTRAEKSWQKKAKAEADKAKMSEIERLKTEKKEAEEAANAALSKANTRLLKSEVIIASSKLGIIDADTAFILMDKDLVEVTDDGKVKGVDKALKLLIKEKPFLAKTSEEDEEDEDEGTGKIGDNQQDGKKSKGGIDMNNLIRKAAGRK